MNRLAPVLVVLVLLTGCGQVAEQPPTQADAPIEQAGSPVASADGLPIAFSDTGEGNVAVVMIHGWMCDQSYWDDQVPFLSENYRVVTVDLGGHGESGLDRAGWPLSAYAEDVKAVVDHLGLAPVILVGHSMGGPVAVEAAGLIGDDVLGVVGVDTFQNVEAKYDPEQMKPFIEGLENDFPATCYTFVQGMFAEGAEVALMDRIAGDMCDGPAEVGTALMRQFLNADLTVLFSGASVPIRSVNADLWPTDIEANRRHHEDYDAVFVEGVGHFLMMENPDVFNPVLAAVLMEVAHSGM